MQRVPAPLDRTRVRVYSRAQLMPELMSSLDVNVAHVAQASTLCSDGHFTKQARKRLPVHQYTSGVGHKLAGGTPQQRGMRHQSVDRRPCCAASVLGADFDSGAVSSVSVQPHFPCECHVRRARMRTATCGCHTAAVHPASFSMRHVTESWRATNARNCLSMSRKG